MAGPFSSITEKDFEQRFASEESCLQYLAETKWQQGYTCRRCGHTNYCTGKQAHSRRCTKCKHDESAKVGTMFEGCRFPLPKAFYIAYIVCNAKEISSHELSQKLELRQMTCWSFKKKLLECVQSQGDISFDKKIEIERIILQTL